MRWARTDDYAVGHRRLTGLKLGKRKAAFRSVW